MKETRYKKGNVFRALKDLPYTFIKGSIIVIEHIDFGSFFYYELLTNCSTYFKADDNLMSRLTKEGYIEKESKMLRVTKNVTIGNIDFSAGELIAGLKPSPNLKNTYEFYKISSDLSRIESRVISAEIFDLFRKIAPSAIIEESEESRKDDGCEVRRHSNYVEYYKHGKLHRENDLPAVEYVNGDKFWYKDGKLHREGGMPAVILSNGTSYYKDGKRHRDNDLPAVEDISGFKAWYKDGRLHREGGKPAVIHSNGNKEYWINGKKHCPPTMTEIYLLVYGDGII